MPTREATEEDQQHSPHAPAPPEAVPDYTEAGEPASEEDPRANAEPSKAK